jgi:riboflavin transporter FmnP
MTSTGNALASLVSDPNGLNGFNMINEKVFGIPSFLWGCVFSWVGVLVVYLVGQDKAETKSAIIGCVVGAVAYTAFYAIYYFALSGLYL